MEAAFVDTYNPDIGVPSEAVRLMVCLHDLKYDFDESDESVVARRVENPYWQYFCGYTHMQHECPTNRSNWFVAAYLLENNPYDGHTLSEMLTIVERVTGLAVTDAYVDKGDRGHGYTGGADVRIAGQRRKNTTRAERKRRRRCSAIEPKISHVKAVLGTIRKIGLDTIIASGRDQLG